MLEAREAVCVNDRERFSGDLTKQIDEAYKDRVIQTIKITPDGKSSIELEQAEIKTNRQIKNFAAEGGIPIEDIILIGGTQHSRGAVYVNSFDDFRVLLKLSFEKLVKEGMFRKLDNAQKKHFGM